MLLTLLSAVFGGLLRLAPELFKFMDAKNDRQHELDMTDRQIQLQTLTGQQKLGEIQAQGAITLDQSTLQAISAANLAQAQMATAAGPFAAFLSSLVRPLTTFYLVGMWGCYKTALLIFSFHATGSAVETLINSWTDDDKQMLSMILSFWYVGRTIERNNGQIK